MEGSYQVGPINHRDQDSFNAYLRACTDQQVYGVLAKEQQAGRVHYAALAEAELERRHLSFLDH